MKKKIKPKQTLKMFLFLPMDTKQQVWIWKN